LNDDEQWMGLALREAEAALEKGEVPVGAVVIHDGRLIGRGHNRVEALQDATAHAEILALGAASETLGTWRLEDATMYVTLEPCVMCAGALLLARVSRLVFGAHDPSMGGCGSVRDVLDTARLGGRVEVRSSVRVSESTALMDRFFRELRAKQSLRDPGSPREPASPT
jgi:tRNA(adenine34) deaminase